MLGREELHAEPGRRAELPAAADHHGQGLGVLGRRADDVDPVPDQGHAGARLDEESLRDPRAELRDAVNVGDLDLPLGGVDRYPEHLAANVDPAVHAVTDVGEDAAGVTIWELDLLAGLAVAACRGESGTSHEPQPRHLRRRNGSHTNLLLGRGRLSAGRGRHQGAGQRGDDEERDMAHYRWLQVK